MAEQDESPRYREITTYRISLAACIAAVLLPFAGCQAVKEWQAPKREQVCVHEGGTWAQGYDDKTHKSVGSYQCFPPDPK